MVIKHSWEVPSALLHWVLGDVMNALLRSALWICEIVIAKCRVSQQAYCRLILIITQLVVFWICLVAPRRVVSLGP